MNCDNLADMRTKNTLKKLQVIPNSLLLRRASENISRMIENYYWNIIFLNKEFFKPKIRYRFILVKYSERGLVYKGQPNLQLLNILFWVFFTTMVTYGYRVFPLSQQLKGEFPQNSIKGQICLKNDFSLDEMNSKQRVNMIMFPLVITKTCQE